MHKILPVVGLALLLAGCGKPDRDAEGQTAPDHSVPRAMADDAELTPAQKAYAAVNERLHAGVADIDEDPDLAFMQGMLAHHIGAVEMAEVVLEHGEDAQVRGLAERIIAAQRKEIAEMEEWLAKRPNSAAATTE